jgi:hypothetical protein
LFNLFIALKMTKLRLIKPWGLRTVRQHLSEPICEERLAPASLMMCTGPICEVDDVCSTRFMMQDIRTAKSLELHTLHRAAAPRHTAVLFRISEISIR